MKCEIKKHLIKNLSLIMVHIFLLCSLSACGNNSSRTLSDKEKEEIEAKRLEFEGVELRWWDFENEDYARARYYGKINGYQIIFSERVSMVGANHHVFVGDYTFAHTEYFDIFAYKNGEFYTIAQAYEKGWLKERHIKEIYDIHCTYGK